ncbi:MAG: hypothetical protein WA729_20225 [Pseudolabrys sp.]
MHTPSKDPQSVSVLIAQAAAAAELAASSAPTECDGAINRLAQAVDEARAEIAAMQRLG